MAGNLLVKALRNPGKAWRYASKELAHEVAVLPYAFTRECVLLVGKTRVAFSTRDWYSKEWFFPRMDHGRFHEPAVTRIVETLAPHAPSFIDVGAHLGYFSIIAAALAPEKPTLAYEIDDRAFTRLAENVAHNHLTNVRLFHVAIAAASGVARYHRPLRIDSGEALIPDASLPGTDVDAVTLDETLRDNGVTAGIVKIDVEGAELGVLGGAREMLTKGTILLLEIHGQKLAKFGASSKEVLELLEKEGYETFEIVSHRNAEVPVFKRLASSDEPLDHNAMTLVLRKNDAATHTLLTERFGNDLFPHE